jgi:hypothetical protein
VWLSLALAAAAVLVAASYDLPLRDPDGVVGPTFLFLLLILLAAFLTDVLPRTAYRMRSLAEAPATLVAVVRERWTRAHIRFALVGLGAWYLTYVAFRNLKSFVPFVNGHLWDDTLAQADRMLWLGNDPSTVLHDLLGTTWAAHFFSLVYVGWIGFVPVTLVAALVWSRNVTGGAWYVTAVAVDWVLGVITYFLVPTVGPIYNQPGHFTGLADTWVTGIEAQLWQDRGAVLADPFATHAVQTVAAFASLHVGIMVTVCVMAELLKLNRGVRVGLWVFLGLTELATIYLGWHYFVDTLAGAALGVAGVWIAALGTGNLVHGRLARLETTSTPAHPAGGLTNLV